MKNNTKAILAAMVGNALEYYDVMLYGFFAVMLAPLFFPTDNQIVSTLSSLGTFAAGFIMRPLGGIIFGHLGDKFGRRQALVLAIFLVTIPTFNNWGLTYIYGDWYCGTHYFAALSPITRPMCGGRI